MDNALCPIDLYNRQPSGVKSSASKSKKRHSIDVGENLRGKVAQSYELEHVQDENKQLKRQVSKLKLSLALMESSKESTTNNVPERKWGPLQESLFQSESFRKVGTGKSVLDKLPSPCRRDVVSRYFELLDVR